MIYIVLNAVPILLATLAGLVVSAGYARLAGGGARPGTGLLVLAAVAQGWFCAILAGALILAPPQAGAWTMALGSAVVIWIGFVLPALTLTLRWRGEELGRALADAAAWLTVMLVQAAVLHLIGVHRPR